MSIYYVKLKGLKSSSCKRNRSLLSDIPCIFPFFFFRSSYSGFHAYYLSGIVLPLAAVSAIIYYRMRQRRQAMLMRGRFTEKGCPFSALLKVSFYVHKMFVVSQSDFCQQFLQESPPARID